MTAASMVKEKQHLETGTRTSQTILMTSSIVWNCLVEVHTLANGGTLIAPSKDPLYATMVSFLMV